MEKLSYLINDTRCLAAIEDLENGMNSLKWLGQNLDLYLNISVKADGLPRIANCNYMGKHYDGISNFSLFMRRPKVNWMLLFNSGVFVYTSTIISFTFCISDFTLDATTFA